MRLGKYVLDATMGDRGGLFCFCPVETDEDGNITSVITGMNFLGAPPKGSEVIAVIHEDGHEAAEAFFAKHEDEIKSILAPARQEAG